MTGCDAIPANFRLADGEAPHCECCNPRISCYPDVRLPLDARKVAGRNGVTDAVDLHAIIPWHYDPLLHRRVEHHDSWMAVELRPGQ